jgi:dienelactone hydrolase
MREFALAHRLLPFPYWGCSECAALMHLFKDATDWVLRNQETQRLRLGYFGASTGAAAAMVAAVQRPDAISASVSRCGRPDLAAAYLARVRAPTLLIVGGRDSPVIEMNRDAFAQLAVEKDLRIIPGATHLFEEPGALQQVARLAAEWFVRYLGTALQARRESPRASS